MNGVERLPISNVDYEYMESYLADPLTRIKDSRMMEMYDTFGYEFQVLTMDNQILSLGIGHDEGEKKALDLYKLQYRNNPRNNPGLYGLLDTEE